MNSDLQVRTREFAVRVIRMAEVVSISGWVGKRLADQLLRSGTSVGAHYAEAKGARSDAEFIAKIDGALQELREAIYWIHLIVETKLLEANRTTSLMKEADEIGAMLAASSKTVKARIKSSKTQSS